MAKHLLQMAHVASALQHQRGVGVAEQMAASKLAAFRAKGEQTLKAQIARADQGEGIAWNLGRVRWDLFGTLTFKGRVPPERHRLKPVWRHFNAAATLCARPYGQLLIALRSEHGELGGRFHFHYLLGGTRSNNLITLSHRLEHQWQSSTGAIAKIRPYDDSRSGVAYITKNLDGSDVYEMNKFNLAQEVTFSRSVGRVIRSLERMRKNTRIALAKKRVRLKNGRP